MNDNKLIVSFSDINSTDISLVGGKGANLGEMTQAGFVVPDGFCVTTKAFDIFIKSYTKMQEYYKELANLGNDVEATRVLAKQIRDSLIALEIPKVIKDSIVSAFKKSGGDFAYAVRSSATAEDLPENSFAGQQDTYLNICGEENIVSAIKSCWASLFTDRAILYRNKNNFNHRDVKLSVVVQKMIPSEVSGIMFSVDPLTGNRNIINIDASFGLGEALVSGLVNPDEYKIDKNSNTIVKSKVSQKLLAIYSNKNSGTYEAKIPPQSQNKKVLSDEQILALGDLAKRLESHYGKSQDIEWGIYKNKIYLLQTRPITSLFPISNLEKKGSLHVYFSMGHQQMMTDPISPLGISTIKNVLPIGKLDDRRESKFVLDSAGRLFADITGLLPNPITNKVLMKVSGAFNILAPKMLTQLRAKPNLDKAEKVKFSFKVIAQILNILSKVMANLFFKDLKDISQKAENRINENVDIIKAKLLKEDDIQQKVKISKETLGSLLPVVIFWIPSYISSTIADSIILKLTKNKVSTKDLDDYKLGLKGNLVNDMNFDLGALAESVRSTKQLRNFLESDFLVEKKADINSARKFDDAKDFFEKWDSFIDKYGARGSSEFDIARERWYENPTALIKVIVSYLQKEPNQYLKTHNDLLKRQEVAKNNIINTANSGIFKFFKAKLIKRMLYVVENASVLREHHKFLAVKVMQIIKQDLTIIADKLVNRGMLESREDIWYLSWYELGNLSKVSDNLKRNIIARKNNYKRYQKLKPPLIVTSEGETPIVKHDLQNIPDNAFVGQAVSAGVIEGIARVITDPLKESLKKGEILVAPFTDPGWTPLFINAAGLVTEIGGSLTHGSVVAREYNIPAVVGVTDITNNIKTGQKIRVDGNTGIIEIIELN
ncbi:phosphoenolpyruvate synthase [Francisella sp. 19X1-34]|uniref:phosphoenolpyruvate synthase n=1 Tax=Francisella sp. 19X1-34 TaxID=3087177 RepID=UPI002E36E87B|nr:phosphoenolpyruvate synthase [Francisella sp. 19X1-34]MED7787782.1 phosphoenolpyruvate synthase [Francisella sp. 19X1-34]